MISVVIPVHNEEAHILPLYDRLSRVLQQLGQSYEIIFVDDASTDATFELLKNLVATDPNLVVVRLRRNFGQTAALAAGFNEARGHVIVSMDGDLQHAPEDIPKLLAKLEEGYDIVSGWRKERVDNPLTRKLPSRIANWLIAKISGLDIHDFGTTFKAYRSDIIKEIKLYGDLHRFIPALASLYGARVTEVPIQNQPRRYGHSHYGLGRTLNVIFDLVTLKFLLHYFTRPMHFFGKFGLLGTGFGVAILFYLFVRKLLGHSILLEHGPLMVAGAVLFTAGLLMFSTGILGELLMRIYFESQGRPIYSVREILRSSVALADNIEKC